VFAARAADRALNSSPATISKTVFRMAHPYLGYY